MPRWYSEYFIEDDDSDDFDLCEIDEACGNEGKYICNTCYRLCCIQHCHRTSSETTCDICLFGWKMK